MVNNWLNIIQKYLLPPSCILCENAGFADKDICLPCYEDMPRNIYYCHQCAEIFETSHAEPQRCGRCLSQTPFFDNTYAPFIYHGIARHLIARLKFNKQYKNARLLGTLLAEYLTQAAPLPDLIIPIPLHPLRYKQRGFNQAFEIAKTVSKYLNCPIDNQSCIRIRDTQHQSRLSAKQRDKNMKHAFKVIQTISAQHVAIVDDVITTGATANDLAKTLKKSGVKRVDIWVCARA